MRSIYDTITSFASFIHVSSINDAERSIVVAMSRSFQEPQMNGWPRVMTEKPDLVTAFHSLIQGKPE